MNKRLGSLILSLLIVFSLSFNVFADEDLNINSKSAVLMDAGTGEIIYELNKDEMLPPASITKIMTVLLGVEAIKSGKISLEDEVTISSHASSMGGSQVYLDAGETQKVEELFKAILIRSANDAAVAIGEHIAGSEEIFVRMMNERAQELGMKNTKFKNSSGLPDTEQYSSSHDVAIMSKEILKYDLLDEWLTTYIYDMKVGKNKDKIQTLVNTNKLIKQYEGITGIKTGSTNEAGFCISASAKRGNLELIAVIMGSDSSKERFNEAMRLLDFGFANYDSFMIGEKDEVFGSIYIQKGNINTLDAILDRSSFVLLPKENKDKIDKKVILYENLEAPIMKGDVIGEIIISINGEKTHKVDLVAKDDVEKASLFKLMKNTIKSFVNQK